MQIPLRTNPGGAVSPSFREFAPLLACYHFFLLLACLGLPWPLLARDLVREGQPRAEIVIAAEPARMTKRAADELQTYLHKITGATLPIVTEPSRGVAARIYVGISQHTDALGLDTQGLKYGAYRMASGPDWLALLGPDREFKPTEPYPRAWWGRDREEFERVHKIWDEITGDTFWNPMPVDGGGEWFDDRGTLNAVHSFLHDLGVRWYMPGEIGEVVPQMADIPLPEVNKTVLPDFPVRNTYWFQGGSRPLSKEEQAWQMRLGLHLGHDVVGLTQLVHGMKFVLMREEMKKAHPELYAKRGDGRTSYPCLSSKELFEKHVAYLRKVFDQYGEPMISIDPADGFSGGSCECSDCRAQITPGRGIGGSMSDLVFGYLNRVALALYESHPDRYVSGLTYGAYNLPPEQIEKMAPNFALIVIPQRLSFHEPLQRAAFERQLEAWREKLTSGKLFVFSNVIFNWRRKDNSPLLPVYAHRTIAEHLRSLKGVSEGELIECYEHRRDQQPDWNAQAVAHLALYTYSRAWWNTELDINAMLDEYYRLFYGPAEDAMRAFIEYCEENWPRMRTEAGPIDRAFELIAAAQAAVDPHSIYGQRITLVADYLELVRPLREQLTREREGPLVHLPRRAAKQLAIDGSLDDSFWKEVPEVPLVERHSGGKPQATTTVRFAWADNESLIVGVRCEEPDMTGLRDTADGAMGVFNGDCIDLLIETPVHRYYQITVSPSGALLDSDRNHGLNSQWSSKAVVAAHRGEDYWSIEIQLPAAGEDAGEMDPNTGISGIMPRAEAPWHFNLGRNRPRGSATEFSVVAPTATEHFHNPFQFGRFVVE